SAYTEAIDIDPKFANAYYNRGKAYSAKGDLEAAIGDCTKAIELNPKLAKAYSQRGGDRLGKDDLEGAVADCTKAIELDPKEAQAHLNRGQARLLQGKVAEAEADFKRGLLFRPDLKEEVERNKKIITAKQPKSFDDWFQDFELAKAQAAKDKKD